MSQSPTIKQLVDHYGVHTDPTTGYSWLLQQGKTASAIGLPEKYCEFKIKSPLLMCPHNIQLKGTLERDSILNEYESRLLSSEVLRVFDPVFSMQNPSTVYLQVNDIKQYNSQVKLQRLLNLSLNSALPASIAKDQVTLIAKRLRSSNLASFIVYGMNNSTLSLVDNLARACLFTAGKLIMSGEPMPLYNTKDLITVHKPDIGLYNFIDKLTDKKIKEIGAYRIKQLMRSEDGIST